MLFGRAAISIGEAPIGISARQCRSGTGKCRTARWKCVLPELQWAFPKVRNASALGNALFRDGNAFRAAGNLDGDRSDEHRDEANETFATEISSGEAPTAVVVTATRMPASPRSSAELSRRLRGHTKGDYRGAPPQSLASTWRIPEARPWTACKDPHFVGKRWGRDIDQGLGAQP